MNQTQYTTLFEALAVIPDPRKARGQRYAWALVLTLLAAGLASGQQTIRAIAQWANLHAATLRAALPTLTSLPSESTLLRTARQIDVGILETAIAQLTQPHTDAEEAAGQMVTPCGTILQAQAVDGKTLRGTIPAGQSQGVHLLAAYRPQEGVGLLQVEVGDKENEISTAPRVLQQLDLRSILVSGDAMFTQRSLCLQIEMGLHGRRDGSLQEDRARVRMGQAPHV